MVYTYPLRREQPRTVPVSAHLPMVYTPGRFKGRRRRVPVSAHLPMVYTLADTIASLLEFRLVPISRWCILDDRLPSAPQQFRLVPISRWCILQIFKIKTTHQVPVSAHLPMVYTDR